MLIRDLSESEQSKINVICSAINLPEPVKIDEAFGSQAVGFVLAETVNRLQHLRSDLVQSLSRINGTGK